MSFWHQFEAATCLPDKCQCEAARDAFIRQPSAFWSSFAYILAALAIYRFVKPKSMELRLWALVCGIMGVSSLFAHVSFIRFALAIDFASIGLVLSFFALLNLFVLLKQSWEKIFLYFSLYYVALFFSMYMMNKWSKIGMCLLIFLFAIGDLLREMGASSFFKARTLHLSLLVLAVSFGFFLIDEFHIMCDPHGLYQFHSLWHMGTAIALFFYGKWRFEGDVLTA